MGGERSSQPTVLIQPQFLRGEQWETLARREGLCYEPAECFAPPVIGDPQLFGACAAWYQRSGRVKALHGAFIDVNPASGDPEFRSLSQRRCRESCRLAAQLGAEWVVLHASAFPFLRGAYLDAWADTCAQFYLELAREFGIKLCIENSQDVDTTPLRALMARVESPWVRVCLDLGHANYSQVGLEEWFDSLGEYLGCMHLSDNTGQFDEHLPLGAGTVDWALADRLWRQLGGALPYTLEVGGLEGVERSLAYLRERGYFGMGA